MNGMNFYKVADLSFAVSLPQGVEADVLLPSFVPFRCVPDGDKEQLFVCRTVPHFAQEHTVLKPLEVSYSDLGHVRLFRTTDGYRVEVRYGSGDRMHAMQADERFERIEVVLCMDDVYVGEALCSLLRIAFSQAVLHRGGISIHASAVVADGKSYLFTGKSGTGKSTHAALWTACWPGSWLLNDDNPIVRFQGGTPWVYGSPWSGKTHCYRNACAPLGGVARLRQAPANRFVRLEGMEAFVALLPGCSVVHEDANLYGCLCDTLVRLTEETTVGLMECLPDKEAARVCGHALMQ